MPELVLYHATWCPFCRAFLPVYRKLAKGREVVLDDEADPNWNGIEVVPTVVAYENGKEAARLEAGPGIGISEADFVIWLKSLGKR